MSNARYLLPLLLFLSTTVAASGQERGGPADQAAIDTAVDNGVRYLLSVQSPTGGWGPGTGPGSGKGWLVGYTSLAGIALVEAGLPPSHPSLKQALAKVRSHVNDLDSTYEVSLAILFLDRMKDKKDRKAIEVLAGRLIAGQTATGGWGYKVPKLTAANHEALMTALRKLYPPLPPPPLSVRDRPPSMHLCIKSSDDVLVRPPPPAPDPAKVRASALNSLPPAMKRLPVFLEPAELPWTEPNPATSDNSNTHFATIALWAARRHEVPVDGSLTLLAQRFRTSQGSDGTWGYAYRKNGGGGSKALTCVALMGLAIGHVVDPDPNVKPEQDPKVLKAFTWLSRQIGAPTGRIDGRPSPKEIGGLYYMWAMERIAVLYDVGNLDKKDWYQWGAEILLGHQKIDGSWSDDGGYHGQHPILNTSFALLFLTRANLTPDLSRRLVVDQSTLTAKVDQSVQPKQPTPMPSPKTEPEPEPEPEPLPPPTVTPKPQPPVSQPQPSLSQPSYPPVSDEPVPPTTPTSRGKPVWLWIVVALLVVVFGVLVFLIMKKRAAAAQDDEEEDAPRSKKAKKKQRPKDEDE